VKLADAVLRHEGRQPGRQLMIPQDGFHQIPVENRPRPVAFWQHALKADGQFIGEKKALATRLAREGDAAEAALRLPAGGRSGRF